MKKYDKAAEAARVSQDTKPPNPHAPPGQEGNPAHPNCRCVYDLTKATLGNLDAMDLVGANPTRALKFKPKAAYPYDEEACPGHIASEADPKVCGRCGIHIDGLRDD